VYGVEKKYFVLGRLEQPRLNKNLMYRHDKPKEPTKERPLSFVLFESPFVLVSTVSMGHPSLVSLSSTDGFPFDFISTSVEGGGGG
jgi:hypothetical protein